MLGRFFVSVVLAVSLIVSQAVGAQPTPKALGSSSEVAQFDTEHAAQKHCSKDTVVWLNTNSGIYHERGMRWYGRTKYGAYVCKAEADATGDRDTRNGQ